jgi:hypothetical protein
VFHRLESPTQTAATAKLQEQSREIWGLPARGSSLPSVKAYRDALPAGDRGVEFGTPIAVVKGHGTPWEARWYYHYTPGVTMNTQGYAVIPVDMFKNMQP